MQNVIKPTIFSQYKSHYYIHQTIKFLCLVSTKLGAGVRKSETFSDIERMHSGRLAELLAASLSSSGRL